MIRTTKQDLLDNIFGKFALLGSSVPTIDEQVIEAAGK